MARKRGQKTTQVERQRMITKVRELTLRGVSDRHAIAAALGVSPETAHKLKREVLFYLQKEEAEQVDEAKDLVLAACRYTAQQAMNSFNRSRKDSEEFTITEKECPKCYGTKKVKINNNEEDCPRCDATGRVVTETVKVAGKAGDVAFLKLYMEAWLQYGKVAGAVPGTMSAKQLIAHADDAGMGVEVRELFLEGRPDLVLECLAAIDKVKQAEREGEAKLIEHNANTDPEKLGGEWDEEDDSGDSQNSRK